VSGWGEVMDLAGEKKERIAITITPSDLKVIELVKEKTGLSRNEVIARLLQLGIRQLNYFLEWQRELVGAKSG
jgi:hypothetical protein